MDSPTPQEVAPSVPVSPKASRTNGYEPPRLESLGTVEELTQGGGTNPPDVGPFIGSFSDRRLKDHITALEPGSVLDAIASLTSPGYEPPRLESLGTVEELTMGAGTPFPDVTIQGSQGFSDRRLKGHLAAVDPGRVLDGFASLVTRSA
jgi:hypothetical protein